MLVHNLVLFVDLIVGCYWLFIVSVGFPHYSMFIVCDHHIHFCASHNQTQVYCTVQKALAMNYSSEFYFAVI